LEGIPTALLRSATLGDDSTNIAIIAGCAREMHLVGGEFDEGWFDHDEDVALARKSGVSTQAGVESSFDDGRRVCYFLRYTIPRQRFVLLCFCAFVRFPARACRAARQ